MSPAAWSAAAVLIGAWAVAAAAPAAPAGAAPETAAAPGATAGPPASASPPGSSPPPMPLDELAWIAGCWADDRGDAGSGEVWLPPAGDVLLGVSRTVRRGRTVAHEFMQIRAGADGRPVFIARPSGQAEGRFPLLRAEATGVWFENRGHDFPQRIGYWRDGARLMARVEGVLNGAARSIDFAYRPVPCERLGAPPAADPAAPR